MTHHLALMAAGLAVSVVLALVAGLFLTMSTTCDESSYLKGRLLIAEKLGTGGMERLAQHPYALTAQKWLITAAAISALLFAGWHAILAILSE